MKYSPVLFLIFIILFTTCREDTIDPGFSGSILGKIVDADGRELSEVSVETRPPTSVVRTDSAGNFEIENMPVGEYTITLEKKGFQNETTLITVRKDQITELLMAMEEKESEDLLFNRPGQPIPTSLATGLADSLSLHWQVKNPRPNVFLTFDVLLYASGNPKGDTLAKNLVDTSLVVEGLDFTTTYFWQVIAKDQEGQMTAGEVWSFQTRPFPEMTYLFTRYQHGQRDIYAADETLHYQTRLTDQATDDAFPQVSSNGRWMAHVSTVFGQQQLIVRHLLGKEVVQVTQIPVAGYHNGGEGFCWSPDGGQLLYSHYEKLYRIDRDGTNLTLLATAPSGRHFKSCDWSGVTQKIVVQTIGSTIDSSEFYFMNENGSGMEVVIDSLPGRMESPTFSVDGKYLLFTRDQSGFTAPTGRQLDARIFLYTLDTEQITDLSGNKPEGTNDTYPHFSPDGAYIIFENSSNVLNSPKNIWKMDQSGNNRQLFIGDAESPEWM